MKCFLRWSAALAVLACGHSLGLTVSADEASETPDENPAAVAVELDDDVQNGEAREVTDRETTYIADDDDDDEAEDRGDARRGRSRDGRSAGQGGPPWSRRFGPPSVSEEQRERFGRLRELLADGKLEEARELMAERRNRFWSRTEERRGESRSARRGTSDRRPEARRERDSDDDRVNRRRGDSGRGRMSARGRSGRPPWADRGRFSRDGWGRQFAGRSGRADEANRFRPSGRGPGGPPADVRALQDELRQLRKAVEALTAQLEKRSA